jgi:alkylation response protein AidB-like acyl-CoA dehydrogenase
MTIEQSASERKALQLAEASREKRWRRPSFLKEVFLGRFRPELLDLDQAPAARPEFLDFVDRLAAFLRDEVDSAAIDATGEVPPGVIRGLAKLGAFGMKIPVEYGGLGLSQWEYGRVMALLGSVDGNLTALLSAHQSIGVPQPIKIFGTEDQKQSFLPRCAAGAISGFALTEPDAGSDPASLATTAVPSADGAHFILNGEKLWCTNGTLAELLVVMARNPATDAISAFVVETSWPGVAVAHRCRFMGLRALANGVITFDNLKVPRENLIGEEGKGLKIALVTLNTGRLTLPAGTAGTAATCLEACRKWSSVREQWGHPIGKHEAVAHMLADMTTTTFAMQAVADIAAVAADDGNLDIRLEAAAAKEWNTVRGWDLVDQALQIRGGRGYENEASLAGRGEAAIPIERLLRDSRINRIFEGSSEIMHLFMAREAVDRHLEVAGALIDPEATLKDRLAALPGIVGFYAAWYPRLWFGWGRWPRYRRFLGLARHLRFAERSSRKLAREIFHGMNRFQAGMQRRQAFLFRAVDIATEIFVMTATALRAVHMAERGSVAADEALRLADLFCRTSRRRVRQLFKDLWSNDDAMAYGIGQRTVDGHFAFLEDWGLGLGLDADDLRPVRVSDQQPSGARTSAA